MRHLELQLQSRLREVAGPQRVRSRRPDSKVKGCFAEPTHSGAQGPTDRAVPLQALGCQAWRKPRQPKGKGRGRLDTCQCRPATLAKAVCTKPTRLESSLSQSPTVLYHTGGQALHDRRQDPIVQSYAANSSWTRQAGTALPGVTSTPLALGVLSEQSCQQRMPTAEEGGGPGWEGPPEVKGAPLRYPESCPLRGLWQGLSCTLRLRKTQSVVST